MDETESKPERRRSKVAELLDECTEAKLLRGGTALARERAERAYELAMREPAVPAPWPQLAAYRRAHLILRGVPDVEGLHTADGLLAMASGAGGVLGPMPRLYRLAVMHRLAQVLPPGERESGLRQLEVAFGEAYTSVRTMLSTPEPAPEQDDRHPRLGPVQGGLVNLLELATYFLGLPYEPLDGLGGPFHDLMLGPDSWRVISLDPHAATIRMPRDLALVELDDRGMGHPDAILFRLGGGLAECCLAARSDWRQVNQDGLRLLANLAGGWSIRPDQLRKWVIQDESADPNARFRRIKSRLSKELRAVTGSAFNVVRSPDRRTQAFRLAEGVRVLGATEQRHLLGASGSAGGGQFGSSRRRRAPASPLRSAHGFLPAATRKIASRHLLLSSAFYDVGKRETKGIISPKVRVHAWPHVADGGDPRIGL